MIPMKWTEIGVPSGMVLNKIALNKIVLASIVRELFFGPIRLI